MPNVRTTRRVLGPLALAGMVAASVLVPAAARRAPGDESIVRYVGGDTASDAHDGSLRSVVGVKSYQVLRANRTYPAQADDFGWTYNHAPMLAYWNGRFYLEYLSSPISENHSPMQTLLTSSEDGVRWDKPRVVFPQYRLPNGTIALVHQRMGFYVAPDGRLLVLGFYGLGEETGYIEGFGPPRQPRQQPSVNDGSGIGRVVREVKRDGTFGPIHFVRYNSRHAWNETNTSYPFYTASADAGFVQACRALLEHRLITLQWWEEDRATDGFYPAFDRDLKALSFYHRRDGAVVALWKNAWTALSRDEGRTWSKPLQASSLVMSGAKVWGQRTPDGRYALVYNPRNDNRHRWPLALVSSDDGETFDDLLTVVGEVPPRRFNGLDKAFGPQYVRGIVEGNGTPPGHGFWITYSMNKEDLWVSRIPTPVRGRVNEPVHDTFDEGDPMDLPWSFYSSQWAPVTIAAAPGDASGGRSGRSLILRDEDPYDYARAERVFPAGEWLTIAFRVRPRQADTGRLEIELLDRTAKQPPVRLQFDERGQILALDGGRNEPVRLGRYAPDRWYAFEVRTGGNGRFSVALDGRTVLDNAEMLESVESLERIAFRTGTYHVEPLLRTPQSPGADLPGADERVRPAVFAVDDVSVATTPREQRMRR
jgi:hypothetical protein